MRSVSTLAAFGVLLIALQAAWAPGDQVAPWPLHFAPLLMGMGLLAVAAILGLATGPGGLRIAVLFGIASFLSFLLGILVPHSSMALYAGFAFAAFALYGAWRASGSEASP